MSHRGLTLEGIHTAGSGLVNLLSVRLLLIRVEFLLTELDYALLLGLRLRHLLLLKELELPYETLG
jgi:hypothetical protein